MTALITITPVESRRLKVFLHNFRDRETEHINLVVNDGVKVKPDIYLLTFDRYANQHVLEQYFNFDNTTFIEFLKNKGFYVAENSYANYPKTFQSLASLLNMRHLTRLHATLAKNADEVPVYNMLQDYEVLRFLKKLGYQYIHFGDYYGATKRNYFADLNINIFEEDETFYEKLYDQTILNYLFGQPPFKKISSGQTWLAKINKNINTKADNLINAAEFEGPKFVFAHFLLPHEPYLFDESCNEVPHEIRIKSTEEERYIKQLRCTNNQIKKLVDGILNNNKTPPIIIIQSDEGPFLPKKYFKDGQLWPKLETDAVKIHTMILNAYYLPSINQDVILYPSITPINTFVLIFNEYFGTNYKLLDDKAFLFRDPKYPYVFVDITDKVR